MEITKRHCRSKAHVIMIHFIKRGWHGIVEITNKPVSLCVRLGSTTPFPTLLHSDKKPCNLCKKRHTFIAYDLCHNHKGKTEGTNKNFKILASSIGVGGASSLFPSFGPAHSFPPNSNQPNPIPTPILWILYFGFYILISYFGSHILHSSSGILSKYPSSCALSNSVYIFSSVSLNSSTLIPPAL